MPFDFTPSSFGCDDAHTLRLRSVRTILRDWHPIETPSRRPALAAGLGILPALRILSLRPPATLSALLGGEGGARREAAGR